MFFFRRKTRNNKFWWNFNDHFQKKEATPITITCQSYKTFSSNLTANRNKLARLSPAILSNYSARVEYLSVCIICPNLLANGSLAWRKLPGANAVAYFTSWSVFEEKKMFYNIDEHSEGPLHHWLKRLQLVAWHLSSYDTIHGQKIR
jgi:hypothetical protein